MVLVDVGGSKQIFYDQNKNWKYSRKNSSFVFHVRKLLRTNRFEVICQESFLPGSHSHWRHEPELPHRRGGEGDPEENGNRLKTIRRLMKDPLHWPILGVYIPADKCII